MAIITKSELEELYLNQQLTDQEIANQKKTDRTNIVHLRKKFGIQTRENTGTSGVEWAEKKLKILGWNIKNAKKKDKTYEFDLLIDGKIKVEVIASKKNQHSKGFKFILTSKSENRVKESEKRILLPNGRSRKLFHKVVDFIICVGIDETQQHYWIIPSQDISDELQTLSLNPLSKKSKYHEYLENWAQMK